MIRSLRESFWIFFERRRALREMRRLMAAEAATLVIQDSNPLYSAMISLKEGDLQACPGTYLDQARTRIPDYVLTCPDTIDVLLASMIWKNSRHSLWQAQSAFGISRISGRPTR